MLAKRNDYLHRCLRLHGQVTEIRYGKVQDLGKVENRIGRMWEEQAPMWEIVEAIHDTRAFDASMFGSFDRDMLKSAIQAIDQTRWRHLVEREQEGERKELIAQLFKAYNQIEPASVVLRFINPKRFGIMSSPVQAVLGIRPQRKPTDTYEAYLESLEYIRTRRHFDEVAHVEMALWALQVGVLDGMLRKRRQREEVAKDYKEDVELRRIQTWNLTRQLLKGTPKLDVADALLSADAALAGQIAGIEFELLVVAASQRECEEQQKELRQHIDSLGSRYDHLRSELHSAREIRNTAIHAPDSIRPAKVERLIAVTRKLQFLEEQRT